MNSNKTKTITFRLSEAVAEMLKESSKRNGQTMSSYIEESIKKQIATVVDDYNEKKAAPATIKFQGGSVTFNKVVRVPKIGLLILDPKLA
jgi:predicted DNA-binding protein